MSELTFQEAIFMARTVVQTTNGTAPCVALRTVEPGVAEPGHSATRCGCVVGKARAVLAVRVIGAAHCAGALDRRNGHACPRTVALPVRRPPPSPKARSGHLRRTAAANSIT
ncbi:hypothetical protein XAP6164_2850010 [Xanthomonas phaseoli pv. phaseoli]|nr:hypothetical protein XAP6164_2850010 [Xanthomonas phaseoli pv. phaseoli]